MSGGDSYTVLPQEKFGLLVTIKMDGYFAIGKFSVEYRDTSTQRCLRQIENAICEYLYQ